MEDDGETLLGTADVGEMFGKLAGVRVDGFVGFGVNVGSKEEEGAPLGAGTP